MLVKQIYELLEQAELVDTLEEYSTQWLNKHKSTASYLIHKNKDLSTNAKINCLNNIIHHIQKFNQNTLQHALNPNFQQTLLKIQKILKKDIEIIK
jgi:hypothetical protein